ncbi:hypothetical protein ACWF76_25135 [Streptomyces globisporus]|uniref:hypothetical protein n=1 Tax=Streptomyces sp. MCL20-2 TaxID=2967219 RepID=UPI0029660FB4|nr:hypothetical protein [Streptomyces sp. MCL20-2]
MNATNDGVTADWIPQYGFHLRKAGVQFDAIRVDGDAGRRLADLMEELVGGEPGPVVTESNGRRGVYFLVPPGSTAGRPWPREVTTFNSATGRIGYVPVPALGGGTWPLMWRYPPTRAGRFVHTLILFNAAYALLS